MLFSVFVSFCSRIIRNSLRYRRQRKGGWIYPRVIHNFRPGLIFPPGARDYSPRAGLTMNLLEVTKLVKSYNGRVVVNDVSFLLQQREVVGLLGRNGAGKTTTFRMILGMVEPDSGAVAFDADDITYLPMYKRAGSESDTSRRNAATSAGSPCCKISWPSWKLST